MALCQQAVELGVTGELPHFHCELYRLALSRESRRAVFQGDGTDIQVEVRRESPVQPHLFVTKKSAVLECAHIEESQADGALDLVSKLTCQEYPRYMGLHERHGLDPVRIRPRVQQCGQALRKMGAHNPGRCLKRMPHCNSPASALKARPPA